MALKQIFLFWIGQSKGKNPLSILGPWLLLGDIVSCRILINWLIIGRFYQMNWIGPFFKEFSWKRVLDWVIGAHIRRIYPYPRYLVSRIICHYFRCIIRETASIYRWNALIDQTLELRLPSQSCDVETLRFRWRWLESSTRQVAVLISASPHIARVGGSSHARGSC
jgi:hypothetical protein